MVGRINACLEPLLASHIRPRKRQANGSEARRQSGAGLQGEPQGKPGRAPSGESSPLELFALFARTGTLPWWADTTRTKLLEETLEHLLREAPERLRLLLQQFVRERRPLRRIVNHYGDDGFSALFDLLAPSLARTVSSPSWQIQRQIDLLQEALQNQFSSRDRARIRSRIWYRTLCFAGLVESERPEPPVFLRDLLLQLAATFEIDHATLISGVASVIRAGNLHTDNVIRDALEMLHHEVQAKSPRRRSANSLAGISDDSGAETGQPVSNLDFGDDDRLYIDNAGLTILWPFLGHFFRHLGLVEQNCFRNREARQRAVGLLQYLVTEDPSPPEYLLPIDKLLCGMAPDEVFEFGPPMVEVETEECTRPLQAAIAQAPILEDMSIPAFRGTFLLRQGISTTRDGAWLLRVERKTYDVVFGSIPLAAGLDQIALDGDGTPGGVVKS
uniref:Uncharacterized protein n=1 Tax=Candidatus Kentrum sp. LFY TaxID=2126342 RepID=A0A450X2I6_9GAMM|nr:MAG: hypothetical protein BECKLFY1418C_GA0070996_11454 [Candidatus Kentron sp. LFY]